MPEDVQPLSLTICFVHHPASDLGSGLRPKVYRHYRRDPHKNLGEGGLGLEVEYRSDPAGTATTPIPVDFERAQATIVVVILDRDLAGDPDFSHYAATIAGKAKPLFPRASVLAVAVDDEGYRLAHAREVGAWQTVDARGWAHNDFTRLLFTAMDRNLCGLVTAYLEARKNPTLNQAALRLAFTRKARIFLSHSKHDADRRGEEIALSLRSALGGMSAETYFDAVDLPAGTPWEDMLDAAASSHALVVILTDSYSSRTWCKKEVLAAKRAGVPILVASCLEDYEVRGFPYVGNVPIVQMVPDPLARQPQLIGRLFDEVLRDLVWRCHTVEPAPPGIRYLSRAPELVSLTYLELELTEEGSPRPVTFVYPGVPIGEEEAELFRVVADHVKLTPFVGWKAGIPP